MRDGWAMRRIGEFLTLDTEKQVVSPGETFDLAGVLSFGRGLFRRGPLAAEATSYKYFHVLRADRFVLSRLKGWEGAVAVVPPSFDGAVLSPEFPTYIVDGRVMLPEYLGLLASRRAFWDLLATTSRGMGGRKERVHQTKILYLALEVPPIPEQRRIVDLIEAVDGVIESVAMLRRSTDAARISMRDDVLAPKEHWPERELREITTKIGSGATPRGGESSYISSGVALIRSQNVLDGTFAWQGLAFIRDTAARDLDGVTVEATDVLINITGASVNRVCRVPSNVLPARVNQHVAILRANPDVLDPTFLEHILRRSDIKEHLDHVNSA